MQRNTDRESLQIPFDEMPAERMRYKDSWFDYTVCRDILHHVDISQTMREIVRVAKPGAQLMVNEIYSHSVTDKVRRSSFVECFLYPRMRRLIYGPGKPYITEDERKLNESDLVEITQPLKAPYLEKHFNFLITRVIPRRFESLAKIDRILLILFKPMARYLAGRVLISARIAKQVP
jgi:ubiquinone/menaquinone biosynthesis C-methylase UbiE